MFLGVLLCVSSLSGYRMWVGVASAILWVAGWNLHYLVKFKHRRADIAIPVGHQQAAATDTEAE
jgi:hypothetical protein